MTTMQGLWAYINFCIEAEITTSVCRDLWTWAFSAFISLSVVALAILVWIPIRHALRVRAALRAQEERDAVNFDAIDELRWKGDDQDVKDISGAR